MSSVVAIIKSVIGQVFAVSIEGIQRQIFEGDRLLQGEQLLTGNLGAVTLQTTDGKAIELGNNQQWPLREEEAKQQDLDEDASVEELQQAITAGVDPSAEMDDTAAGPAAAGGSGGGGFGGGHSFVMLDATNQQLQAEVGYTTGNPGELAAAQGVEQERNDNPRSPQELDPVTPTLVISGEAQSLLIGQSTQIRFSFSESVLGFSAADIATSGGTISDLVQIDATTWVATFTRGTSGAPGISVPAGSYTDLVGNPGTAGSLAINGAPQASDSTTSTGENAVLNGNVPAASDVDGTISRYTLITGPGAGNLTFNADGSYSFDPGSAFDDLPAGASREVTFSYTVTDNSGAVSVPASVTITVTGTNDDPVAQAASVSVAEDAALLSGSVVATDVDANASLTFALNNPAPAGLTFNSDGSYSFNAANSAYQSLGVGQSATLTIPYTVTDDQGAISSANLVITVTGSNDDPMAQAASVSVAEDAALLSGSVVATDVDANATLSYALNNPAPAGLTFNADGSYSFNAANSAYQSLGVGQSAVLTIPYTVTDDQGATSTANLVITVTGSNDLSVISSASVNLIESNASLNTGGTLSISDVDGPAPSFNPISNATGSGGYGLFKLGSDGLWSYTTTGPLNQLVAGQTYTDTLTVTATDGSTGTITVSILGTNDAPALGGVRTSFTYSESAASGITRTLLDSSVTLTDIDSSNFDGGSVIVSISNGVASQDQLTVQNQGTASGQISVAGSNVLYNFGSGAISIGTISGGTAGIPLTISLNGNATPVAVDALIQRIAYGNSSQLPDTTPRTISVTVNDGDGTANGGSSSVTQNITMGVASVNDAPTLSNLGGTRTFTEGGSAVVLDSNASLGDRELATLADFGGASLTLSRRGGANGDDDFTGTGSLTLSAGEVRLGGVLVGSYDLTALANGTLQITFNSGISNAQANSVLSQIAYSNGSDAPPASVIVDYVLNDNNSGAQGSGGAKTATGSVTVNITPVNDAPAIADASVTVAEDITAGTVLTNVSDSFTNSDLDRDGQAITYTITGGNAAGLFAISSTGEITLASGQALDFETASQHVLTVTASDGTLSDTAAITVNVSNVNDNAPAIADASVTVAEDITAGTVLTNVSDSFTNSDLDRDGQAITYTITGGNAAGLFAISSTTGEITLASGKALDFETASQHVLTITASDGTLSDTAAITVNVSNVNDNAPAIADASVTVAEDITAGTVLTNVSDSFTNSDLDRDGQAITYTITGGNAAGLFAISSTTGEITLASGKALDFETASQHVLTITASDGTLSDTAAITVNVSNVNDNAPAIADANFTVAEDITAGTVLTNVSDSFTNSDLDRDGQAITYTITGGNAAGLFAISSTTGEITLASGKALDFETASQHVLTITASDGTLSDTAAITVNVSNVNDNAPAIADANVTVAEDITAGTVLTNVSDSFTNSDLDRDGQAITYTITGGNAAGLFAISSTTGEITLASGKALDFETASQHVLTITASDGTLSDTAAITVNVSNVNDNAPAIADASVTVAEDITAGTVLTNVSDSFTNSDLDRDGQAITYTITGGNAAGLFAISSTTGEITLASGKALDFETASQHVLTITASDGTLSDTAAITVNVSNVNDNAPAIADANFTVAEDITAGTVLTNVSDSFTNSDLDRDGQAITYTITGGNAAGLFAISSTTGEITLASGKALDFETASQHVLTITASDGTLSDTAAITVNVSNVNDNAPAIADANVTVAEDITAGTVLTNVSDSFTNSDLDRDGQAITYTITGGNAAGLFAISSTTGEITLASGKALDFETASQHVLTITASDGTLSDTAAITVNVSNVNDNAPAIADANFTVAEDITAGTVLTNVSDSFTNSDLDRDGQAITYTITGGNAAGLFAISSTTGEITLASGKALDFETASQHVLTITASDGTLSDTAAITVNVSNVNDNAPAIADANVTVAEDITAGTVLTNVSDSFTNSDLDRDGQAITYTITGGNAAGLFAISSTTGEITLASGKALDFETASQHVLTITASDGTLSDTAAITVNVSNVNDNAPAIADANFTVAEDITAGTVLTNVSDSFTNSDLDRDGQAITYTITGGNAAGLFAISSTTGEITLASGKALDFETASQHVLTITASDGTLSDTAAITVNVSNVNDNAPAIADANVTVAEDITAGTVLTNVSDSFTNSDLDRDGQAITYTITGGNAAGLFAISSTTGEITLASGKALDFETASQHVLTITASDGTLSDTAAITVNVSNVNDNAPAIADANVTVAEDITAGTVLTNVSDSFTNSDLDRDGQAITYTITGGNAAGLFAISSTTGEITLASGKALDFETASQHVLTITASDGTLSDTAAVTVNLTNVDDNAPVLSVDNPSVNLAENAAAGVIAGADADAFDADGDVPSFALLGAPVNSAGEALFSINSSTGEISLTAAGAAAIDFESATKSYTLTVQATANGQLSNTRTVTINLTNVNEPPVNTLPVSYPASEDTALKLSGLSVSDVDAGSANLTVTLSVASGTLTASTAGGVTIGGSGTGELTLTGSQTAINNYLNNTGTQPTYNPVANANGTVALTMTTSDNGSNGSGGTKTDVDKVNIVITPVNDATAPTVTSTLKGQWTFNEPSGSSTTSNQSTGASGTLNDTNAPNNNLPTFNSSGVRNTAAGNYIEFRDAGDRVEVAAPDTQALMGTSSMAFWINTTQTGNNSGSGSSWDLPTVLGSEQNGGGNDIQWGAINNSGKIGFGLGNVGGVYSTTSINDDKWHHVVITRDATTKLVQVYVNGVLEASGSPDDARFDGTLNRLTSIGVNNNFASNGSDLSDNRFFQGKLDDLRIYNRVLTADQIQAVRAVENGFQNTALANDGNDMLLALTGTYSAMAVSGLLAGMTIRSGDNSVTVSGPDQTVNLTGWDLSNLRLSNADSGSTTLLFTAQSTHAATGDIATTYHAVSLANGTSQLVELTAGADTRSGSTAADLIRGGAGTDLLNGGDGNDRLEGGADSDTLNGDAGNDLLIGEAGNDILFGGANNDTLLGGDGTDTLRGGSGNDLLVGGSGADTFLWRNGDTGNDVIKDFNAEGDHIDLSNLLDKENDGNILNYLRVDTATSTLQISTTGVLNSTGSNADVTIKLENGSGGNADLSSLGSTSTQIVNSLIAGADPIVKIDHS